MDEPKLSPGETVGELRVEQLPNPDPCIGHFSTAPSAVIKKTISENLSSVYAKGIYLPLFGPFTAFVFWFWGVLALVSFGAEICILKNMENEIVYRRQLLKIPRTLVSQSPQSKTQVIYEPVVPSGKDILQSGS